MLRSVCVILFGLGVSVMMWGCTSRHAGDFGPGKCEGTDQRAMEGIHISQADIDALTAPFQMGMTEEDVRNLSYEYEELYCLIDTTTFVEAYSTSLVDGTELVLAFKGGRIVYMEVWAGPRAVGDVAIGASYGTLKRNHPHAPCLKLPGTPCFVEVTDTLRALFSYKDTASLEAQDDCPPDEDDEVKILEIRPQRRVGSSPGS